MPAKLQPVRVRRQRHDACIDPVVGAILSGWRYDISGISPAMRGDYEAHLAGCSHCRGKLRLHRTVDVLLLCATTLSFAAFLLAALVMRKLEAYAHLENVRVHLHQSAFQNHIPASVEITLQAVASVGVFISLLLWVLVAIATPIPGIVTGYLREHVSAETRDRLRDRLFKHAA